MNSKNLTEVIENIIDDLQEALYEYQILEKEVVLMLKIARIKGELEELLNE